MDEGATQVLKESVHHQGGAYHRILNNATVIIQYCCYPTQNKTMSGIEINTFLRFNCVIFMRNKNTLTGRG